MELLSVAAVALLLYVGHVSHFLTQPLSFRLPADYEAPE
jgi:hypothetical protein